MNFSGGFLSHSFGLMPRLRLAVQSAAIPALMFATLSSSGFGEGSKPFRAARLTFMEGQVRVEQANSTANGVAVVNMPLVEGTVISSGADGQAEIEFEDGSLARIAPNSGLSLVNLSVDSSGTYQTRIAVLGGLSYFELRAGTKYAYSVDAGGDLISPVENATVRVSFDEPPATIAVLDGSAHITAAGGANVDAGAGQTVHNEVGSADGVYTIKQSIAPESWDRWNQDRDEAAANEEGSQTDVRSKFAGNQGYGWSDLDASGSWYDVPGHGQIWQPDVAAPPVGAGAPGDVDAANQDPGDGNGFDPYGYGAWAWTPAGYSWASGYAWGWLPYRCGQWGYYDGFGWGWSPNLFCGTYGFGGFGYGGTNFGHAPLGYRRPHKPIPGPGPIHPILRGKGGPVPAEPLHRVGGERVIAGSTVRPIEPVGAELLGSGGSTLGAGLRRDYPVDLKSHAPVTGVLATTHRAPAAGSDARAAWQAGNQGSGQMRVGYPQRPVYGQPTRGGFQPGSIPKQGVSRPGPANQPAPVQRQAPSAPRYSPPPPPPASHSAPAATSSSPRGK